MLAPPWPTSAAPAISAPQPKIAASVAAGDRVDPPVRDVARRQALVGRGALLEEDHPRRDGRADRRGDQQQQRVEATARKRRERPDRLPDRAPVGLDHDRGDEEQAVEDREAEHDPLPAPVATAAEREDDQHDPERGGDGRAEVKVGEADADRDELGDQRDEVREQQVDRRRTSPRRGPKRCSTSCAVAAVGDRADAHAHLLADDRHREGDEDERQEEAEPVGRARRCVGDHARAVVLAEHREDRRDRRAARADTSGGCARERGTPVRGRATARHPPA